MLKRTKALCIEKPAKICRNGTRNYQERIKHRDAKETEGRDTNQQHIDQREGDFVVRNVVFGGSCTTMNISFICSSTAKPPKQDK